MSSARVDDFYANFPRMSPRDLTFLIFPSPGIDWTSPGSLTRTTLRNKLLARPRGIGHVAVMIRSPERNELTGMTQKINGEGRREILLHGYGLGILLHNFVGRLESAEELVPEIEGRSQRGKGTFSYARIDLSLGQVKRLFDYLDQYRARGGDRWYGMRNRPRYLEGGGCGPFAASCLEIAGMLTKEIETAWTRVVRVPADSIGGPTTKRYVSALRMMRLPRWATEIEAHEMAHFWDPDRMHAWVMAHGNRERWKACEGVSIDASQVKTPEEPLFFV